MEELNEMMNFLSLESRDDLRKIAMQYVLGLTGTEEGCKVLIEKPALIACLINLTKNQTLSIAKDACLALVNLSADEYCSKKMLECRSNEGEHRDVISSVLTLITDPNCPVADPACMLLANLTRPESNVEQVLELIKTCGVSLDQLFAVLRVIGYNKKGASLNYMGPVFSNLSQSPTVRRFLLDRERCVIQHLLPATEYEVSVIKRGGIVGTLRNCCFEVDSHEWLLSPDVDILPYLLLPLAGPETFSDDENDKLPVQLQYLPESKIRDVDPDIRRMLLESLTQLCATRHARELMRNCNVYLILREFHKWETDKRVLLACENLVDILIRTEEEIGRDNIRDIEVPPDMTDKFSKMDEDFIKS